MFAVLGAPAPASASSITGCSTDAGYLRCGRAFPDPEAGFDTDPDAEGNVTSGGFIQFGTGLEGTSEMWDGLRFLESRYDRWLEIRTLEEMLRDSDARSAGMWVAGQRQRLPLILARVTDETVPAEGKQRFVFTLSLHGIERAGVEGGTRALEDYVTYARCENLGSLEAARADAICSQQTQVKRGAYIEGAGGFPPRILPWDATSPTMGEMLRKAEIYFAYVNPDGWHRGDVGSPGGVGHYQRYNGNGADPNRDWPTVGYTFRPYTPSSEPETRAFETVLRSITRHWAGGGDLHGQGAAPALTYSMLAAGQHDYAKDQRIRHAVQRAQHDAAQRLSWSPLIVQYGETRRSVPGPLGPIGQMYPQQWGTVWDTIGYTTTGDFGGFLSDDEVGLDAIPLDNEMSFSHVTNCGAGSCFSSQIEQLHVAGNKGLVASHIDSVMRTSAVKYRFPFKGHGAYVTYDATVSEPASARGLRPVRLPAQDPFTNVVACGPLTCTSGEFEVKGTKDGVFNAGLTLDLASVATHGTVDLFGSVEIQRFGTDDHEDEARWETVGGNFSMSQAYLSNGTSVAVNDPEPGNYRILLTNMPGAFTYEISFTSKQAWQDPGQRAFSVSPLKFFDDLNEYLPRENRFAGLSVRRIIEDPSVLTDRDVLVLIGDALPGWDEEVPKNSSLSKREHDAYYGALRAWVKKGGRLVLLDGAMRALTPLAGKLFDATQRLEYAGNIQFSGPSFEDSSYSDPLARDINLPGAAEGSGHRHQTYEPVPLGYKIPASIGGGESYSPVWTVGNGAVKVAGGRVVGQTGGSASLGEIPLGKGVIRFAGALLPTPTTSYDHPFGLKSYALTYTGWQLFENLVDTPARTAGTGTKVLGGRKVLPETGVAPGWLLFALALAVGLILARRLRDIFWI